MDTQITTQVLPEAMEAAVMGDLAKLTPAQRVNYYRALCTSLNLNPLSKPFDYITLNGKLTLYARKDCTDQMRASRKISITGLERETINGVYIVTAHARAADGRTDSSIGAVFVEGLKGDALANALMKAETKAKRRVTLSIAGLGWLDETEIETVPIAHTVVVSEQGEILSAPPQPQPTPVHSQPALAMPPGNGHSGSASWLSVGAAYDGWTNSPAERAEFAAFREGNNVSDADAKRLAATALEQPEPLQYFRDFPGDRARLQAAILWAMDQEVIRAGEVTQ